MRDKSGVAPIGLRYPRHTPCEPASWRRFLPRVAAFVLAVITGALVLPAAYLLIAFLA